MCLDGEECLLSFLREEEFLVGIFSAIIQTLSFYLIIHSFLIFIKLFFNYDFIDIFWNCTMIISTRIHVDVVTCYQDFY